MTLKTSNGLSTITIVFSRAYRGIQEDSKVAKKMVMCFHYVEGWRFWSMNFTAVHAVARVVPWVYKAIV